MSYRTRRFQQGLSGKKPSSLYIDEEGHEAQEAGYEAFLTNQNLAEQLSERSRNNDGSYTPDPPTPLTSGQRFIWKAVGLLLLWCAYKLSMFVAEGIATLHQRPFDWSSFFAYLLIAPGGLLFWPGVWLIVAAFDKET